MIIAVGGGDESVSSFIVVLMRGGCVEELLSLTVAAAAKFTMTFLCHAWMHMGHALTQKHNLHGE